MFTLTLFWGGIPTLLLPFLSTSSDGEHFEKTSEVEEDAAGRILVSNCRRSGKNEAVVLEAY